MVWIQEQEEFRDLCRGDIRELRDFFVFEDISELGIFERDWCGSSGGCGDGFGGNVVGGEVGIKVNRSSEGFPVASDVGDREKKEFVMLWIDLMGTKDSWETTFRLGIRRIGRIWWNRRLVGRMKRRSWRWSRGQRIRSRREGFGLPIYHGVFPFQVWHTED